MTDNREAQRLALTYVWWQPAAITLATPRKLLCQILRLGPSEDFLVAEQLWGEEALRAALLGVGILFASLPAIVLLLIAVGQSERGWLTIPFLVAGIASAWLLRTGRQDLSVRVGLAGVWLSALLSLSLINGVRGPTVSVFAALTFFAGWHIGPRDAEKAWFVRDNGIGFEMGQASRLFENFTRLPSATGYEGSGIGLALVKKIIERHGGDVWAHAEPDRGAAFFFRLGPAEAAAGDAALGPRPFV